MRLHPAEWIRESAGYMKEKNKTGNWLLNAVYPRRCPICDGLLSREELYLCRNCVEKIHPILGARCKKCGKPVGSEEEFCRDCSRTRHSFDRGFAPYGYHGELEVSLMRFKYHERQALVEHLITHTLRTGMVAGHNYKDIYQDCKNRLEAMRYIQCTA